jgi:hypothetical protein
LFFIENALFVGKHPSANGRQGWAEQGKISLFFIENALFVGKHPSADGRQGWAEQGKE